MFITISGLIGAGKSTLAKKLSERLNLKLYKEPVEGNPYLSFFYSDMSKWSFQMEMFLLKERFKQQKLLEETGGVQDRSIYEDLIFAEMLTQSNLMVNIDFEMYKEYFDIFCKEVKYPNIMIHLDVSPEIALKRISERGRECEKNIPLQYMEELSMMYKKHIEELSKKINIIIIPYNEYIDTDEIISRIERYIREKSLPTVLTV